MAAARQERNHFYRDRYPVALLAVLIAMILMIITLVVVLYLVINRPLPEFYAETPTHQRMQLQSHDSPNLLSTTLLRWAAKTAVAAYTFDFAQYNTQLTKIRPYFTDAGWVGYSNSVSGLISTILAQKLLVYGVVAGTPIISNQGELPGHGYAWRVQIPFLVVYQGADVSSQTNYTILMTIVKVPTTQNPAGIGIDQFVMAGASL